MIQKIEFSKINLKKSTRPDEETEDLLILHFQRIRDLIKLAQLMNIIYKHILPKN